VGGGAVLVSGLAAMSLTLATGASAATAAPAVALKAGSTQTVHAQTWTMGTRITVHRKSATVVMGNVCHGLFLGPESNNAGGIDAGVEIECLEPIASSAAIVLDKCVRVGGPDDFDCTPVAHNTSGLKTQYFYTVNTTAACKKGTSAQWRPVATNLSANYVDYPDIEGNVVTVACK
jgi:hypothetical protein